jgi:hypothetical protein
MKDLITEARELCELRRKQKHIPMTMLDKTLELCDALEKAERESGCDYCLITWPNYVGGLSDIWHGNQLSVGYGIYREINYCPMCGRPLK